MVETAVILAAGMGTRLKPFTDHAPKCLTEINGVPILMNALENLSNVGIRHCTIVGGYFSEKVKSTIGSSFRKVEVSYLLNEHYSSTNDMYSLWLARHLLSRGTLLLEGDIFFGQSTIERALSTMGNRSCYLAGKYNGKMNEILISVDHYKRVHSIEVLRGKSGSIAPNHYMSTGVLIIQKQFGNFFSQWLTEFISRNDINVLFDDVLSAHIEDSELFVFEIAQEEWVEIDTIEDVREAERVFA